MHTMSSSNYTQEHTREVLFERKREVYKRRIFDMLTSLKIKFKWSKAEIETFIDRLMWASSAEGIDNMDLKAMVRMYNRELIGKHNNGTSIKV